MGVLALTPFLEHKQRGPLTREGQTSTIIYDLLSQTKENITPVTLSLYPVSVLLWLSFLCLSFNENVPLYSLFLVLHSITLRFTLLI